MANIIKSLTIVLMMFLSGCVSKYEKLYNQKPAFYSYISGDVHINHIGEEYNSKVYATPASCQKIVTTLVALKAIEPEYKYTTSLFVIKKNGKVHDMIIKGSGDPTLTSSNLTDLLKPMSNKKIYGNIIIDVSAFKTPPYSRNLMLDDVGKRYSTPVSAVNIDKNLISVKLSPKKLGELAEISADQGYKIKSDVVTNNEESFIKLTWLEGAIHAKGNIKLSDPLWDLKISPVNHDEYILKKVKSVLSDLNIKGKVKVVKEENLNYSRSKKINAIESEPLKEIIKPALKISDNLVFDSIYLTVVNYYANEEIKEWEQGSDIIKQLINKHFGVDAKEGLFVDGSGLSRYNRVQPVTLFLLLQKGFDMPEFIDALASPKEENSTLKNRINLANDIKAKTGYMSGITCLCGYKIKANPKAFVFMSNGFAPPSKELFDLVDTFISKDLAW